MNELGNAFLSSGEYKRAIDYFQQSLAVAREIGYISGQIASLINLGNAYYTRISGNRAEKIENSIAAYTSALQVCTRDGFLEQWAEIQYSLGNAYSERLNGNKTDNLELSIKAYNAALSVFTREAFPTQWAMTQYKLGNIYFNRIEGDKANKIEKTIAAYKAALKILTLETFPNEWARTQNNLGDIYCNRIRGDKASNIKKAIAAYKKALAFFTADTFPSEWARIQSSLGDAYFNKIQGDKAENLELAIACYQAARQVYTREAFPYKWADTCKNIGNAYTAKTHSNNLNYIDYLDNIEYAILFYQDALKIYTTYNFPDEFAIIREKLSEAHYLLEYYQRELEFASSPQPIIYNTPLARIEFVKRNLLDLDVDALVNPTGLDVSYGGSISFQLHERLGLELYNQLRQQPILRLGEVFVTDAGSLSAQYLIHTPTEVSRNVHTISSVGQGINAALLEAEKLDNVWTLAFPSIGSGAAGLSPATLATEILKITTNHLKKGSQLEKVIFAFVDEATYQAYIIAYQRLLLEKSSVVCKVSIAIFSKAVIVGEEVEISINLNQVGVSEDETYLFQISHNDTIANELNIILNAPGFQLNGDNTASLPLDPDTAQETQTARFHLTAFRSGNATITAEIFRGDTFETKLETQIQVADIDEATFTPQRITTQPRPVPQPDFILRIQTIWNETNSTYKFQYQLTSFRFASVFTGNSIYTANAFSSSWIEQTRGLLAATLENISGSLPTEGKSRLISLGQYLFGQIIPTQLQSEFRSLIPQNSTFTLLIVADQEAWIPWELLYDGQRFFGDRFIIGRWLQELNDTRPYEFPVGAVNVAHYANVEQPQLWATLLEAPGAPPPQSLPAGVLHDSTEAIRGLHLIRYSQSSDADLRNAPVTLDNINHTEDIEFQMRPAKLNLRRNRPFVTLSYVKTDAPELTALENTWASAFIRAGCSGFTGSLWAVEPAVEAAFISCFYNRLWAGASLSEAFYTSRQLARVAAPDSLDWLAYVLFGDPMARPYRPVPGDGYAIVEPIGREIDDPLPPGAIARFRVTLRRNPPVWHEDRVIEVAENLLFENLQVHIVTYGLQVIPDLPVTMKLTGKGDYLGWFTLVVPNEITDTSALVQVYFADGMRPIHSLNFSLNIENGREE
ncbi:MAG: macro domain-containing protein [Nostoc sp. CmiVER01]|uniref:macro domain-containing protein n=1 Tax=Nostoc sp. CmiVER01 TaxID=3075384 RepID=UPI002AD435C3|nr:macro domain-containing protein [Nostoc sp. CmiVER01]MDZ8126788.1 tetratricopeptide repeat protein [Nostoc sp. CmiVER01]